MHAPMLNFSYGLLGSNLVLKAEGRGAGGDSLRLNKTAAITGQCAGKTPAGSEADAGGRRRGRIHRDKYSTRGAKACVHGALQISSVAGRTR